MPEVEKRASIKTRENLELLKNKLSKLAKLKNEFSAKTWLYREPHYIRLRDCSDKEAIIITVKKGTYNSLAREEYEIEIKKEDANTFKKILESFGFRNPVYIETKSTVYENNNFSYQITESKQLGIILEIEKITSDENKIKQISEKIGKELQSLGLEELPAETYQKMIDAMYMNARETRIYRYTSDDEGIFSAGKRLLPEELVDEVIEKKKWLKKPDLPEGNYRFYLTEKGNEKYEQTLLHSHKKYLKNINLEEYSRENLNKIIYEDEYQIVEKLK